MRNRENFTPNTYEFSTPAYLTEGREREINAHIPHAIILAGGKGTRLGLTDRPKPMAEVNGRPIFDYQIDEMQQRAGVSNIVFAAGHLSEVLTGYVGDGTRYNLSAKVSVEDSPLGRGGAIKKALKELPQDWEEVIVTNGDNLWQIDFQEMIQKHRAEELVATIAVVQPMDQFGRVEFDKNGIITKFGEKERRKDWINAGVYVFSRDIEDMLPDIGDHETTTFQELVSQKKLGVYKSELFWKNIDTPKDLAEAQIEIIQKLL